MGALDWLRDKFNGVDEDEMYDQPAQGGYEDEYEEESSLKTGRTDFVNPKKKRESNVLNFSTAYESAPQHDKMVISKPMNVEEAAAIGDYLRQDVACVINLEDVDYANAQRIADFIGGASYALSCVIERISNNIFVVVPPRISITNEMREEIKSGGSVWNKFTFK